MGWLTLILAPFMPLLLPFISVRRLDNNWNRLVKQLFHGKPDQAARIVMRSSLPPAQIFKDTCAVKFKGQPTHTAVRSLPHAQKAHCSARLARVCAYLQRWNLAEL